MDNNHNNIGEKTGQRQKLRETSTLNLLPPIKVYFLLKQQKYNSLILNNNQTLLPRKNRNN